MKISSFESLSHFNSTLFIVRLEKLAEANKQRVILEAEAEAEAVRMRGEAEAFAIEAKAKAEAEQMSKKADAWKEYREAAMVDMLLDALPKVTYVNCSQSFLFWLFLLYIFLPLFLCFRLLLKLLHPCLRLRKLLWFQVALGILVQLN